MTGPTERLAIFVLAHRGIGAEAIMLILARGKVERGYTVDLLLSQAEGAYLNVIPESTRPLVPKASRVLLSLLALVYYLRNERPQEVLNHRQYSQRAPVADSTTSPHPIKKVMTGNIPRPNRENFRRLELKTVGNQYTPLSLRY